MLSLNMTYLVFSYAQVEGILMAAFLNLFNS